jgi:UDP-2-acetamido-3-amino-2,3-dideoxy-glucuronate N-acetyltransferase
MVAGGVRIGNNVKVQNNVSIYEGLTIEDDVFLGPSCVLTNVSNPRAQVNRRLLYEETLIKKGGSVGANATITSGVTLGYYCFIAAGAVVTADVKNYALMKGVPAKQKGWISRHGHPLISVENNLFICPVTKMKYEEKKGQLICLDLGEEDSLPEEYKKGKLNYRNYK